jgi:hypothetical protein
MILNSTLNQTPSLTRHPNLQPKPNHRGVPKSNLLKLTRAFNPAPHPKQNLRRNLKPIPRPNRENKSKPKPEQHRTHNPKIKFKPSLTSDSNSLSKSNRKYNSNQTINPTLNQGLHAPTNPVRDLTNRTPPNSKADPTFFDLEERRPQSKGLGGVSCESGVQLTTMLVSDSAHLRQRRLPVEYGNNLWLCGSLLARRRTNSTTSECLLFRSATYWGHLSLVCLRIPRPKIRKKVQDKKDG